MKLIKVPGSRERNWGSAWWEVSDFPGVIIYNDQLDPTNRIYGWRVEYANLEDPNSIWWMLVGGRDEQDPGQIHPQASAVAQHLKGQVFPTRQEALQAVEVALLLIKAEEGDKE